MHMMVYCMMVWPSLSPMQNRPQIHKDCDWVCKPMANIDYPSAHTVAMKSKIFFKLNFLLAINVISIGGSTELNDLTL